MPKYAERLPPSRLAITLLRERGFTGQQISEILKVFSQVTAATKAAHARHQAAYHARKKTGSPPPKPSVFEGLEPSVQPQLALDAPPGKSLETRGRPKKTRRIGTICPPTWAPNAKHYQHGAKLGLDYSQVLDLAEEMRRWSMANANRQIAYKVDWDQAFHNWMASDVRRNPRRPTDPKRSIAAAARSLAESGFTISPRPVLRLEGGATGPAVPEG